MTAAPSTQSVKELWADVAGYEGIYQVSNLGKVRRVRKDSRVAPFKVLRPAIKKGTSNGYAQITLSKNNVRTAHYVHRIVATAFVPGDTSLSVDHIDKDKTNNSASNLRWISKADNTRLSYPRANGRFN